MRTPLRFDVRPLVLTAVALFFYSRFVQTEPYHFDTAVYLQSVRDADRTGALVHPFPTRPLNTYLYWIAVHLFGPMGAKAAGVAGITLFAPAYYSMVKRWFGAAVAFAATLLILFVPATQITVTHLKEDYWALLMMALALRLASSGGILRALGAGAALALAWLFKEVPVFALPLTAATLCLAVASRPAWLEASPRARVESVLRHAIAFLAAMSATVAALAPHQIANLAQLTALHNTGQFLGPFSAHLPLGLWFFREGMLHLFWPHVLVAVSVIGALRKREGRSVPVRDLGAGDWTRSIRILWALTGIALWEFLANITVTRGRLFVATAFFFMPLIVDGARVALETILGWMRRPVDPESARARVAMETALVAAAALVGAIHVRAVLPTLEYRLAYPPQASFYRELSRSLPADALLLTYDDAALAHYFTGRECLMHPIDPDTAAYRRFAAEVRARIARQPVFALDDFLSYDGFGALRDHFSRDFTVTPAFSGLGEDYHRMTYCRGISVELENLRESLGGCSIVRVERRPLPVNPDLSLVYARYELQCTSGPQTLPMFEYKGVCTPLAPRAVYRVQ